MSYYEDEIYHSGYLDGYYASMELYHSDDEMTDEEKAAKRRRRRRNIALGVGGAAALGVGGYAYSKAKGAERDAAMNDLNDWIKSAPRTRMRKSAPKPKRNIPGFRRNPGTYTINPVTGDFGSYLTLHGMHIKARQKPYKK